MDSFTALLFLVGSLGIVTIATLAYITSGYRPEVRFALVASLLLIAALFAFSSLFHIAHDPKLLAVLQERAKAYAEAQERGGSQYQVQTASALARNATPGEVVMTWTRLYGRDTLQASTLTTARLRNGQTRQEWGERTQAVLQEIGYQHMGGEIVEEKVSGEVATVVLKTRIVAVDGVSLQKEIYVLKRVSGGRWLIDELRVEDEVVPGGKLRFAF